MGEIPKLWCQGPGTATRLRDLQTDNICRQRGGGTCAPAMSVRCVGSVVIISCAGSIAESAVGEIALDASAVRSVGFVKIPSP